MTRTSLPAPGPRSRRTTRWEIVLAIAIVVDIVVTSISSPYFLDPATISDATFTFTEKGLVALALALLVISGEIDISVAGTIALASVAMGLAARSGVDVAGLVAIGIGVGAGCGAINGLLVTWLEVPSIVATIGTMSLFRGAAYAILGDRAMQDYPAAFAFFGQGYVIWVISLEAVVFAIAALAIAMLLHGTIIGRRIFAIGANPIAARFSGIPVRTYRFWLFVVVGAAAGLASIMLTSRIGSTRPSIAQGWELDIVSIVILGGVAIAGGRGTILGVVLASALLGFVLFGFSLINVPGIVASMLMGALLIIVVAGPRLNPTRRNREVLPARID